MPLGDTVLVVYTSVYHLQQYKTLTTRRFLSS
jgi:hypothetical protein